MTSSADIRKAFLEFFRERGHAVVPSGSLVPANDPTLLFANAGMNQFKDVFLGREQRPYSRATSSQRCVRAGGKHNDLENVGYTARHHTFFEMLGNFSFGDYFKHDAIRFAWTFLTETIGLPKEKLWVTVFEEDDEAARIWLEEIGVDPGRLSRIGAKDNFWAMGDTGPCGPCTEIFYDHGPAVAGGPPGTPEEDGDRYIEIWNLVFMQFDRAPDGSLTPLPKPCVDTGMGLERLTAVVQGVHNNFDTDLFVPLIRAAADIAGTPDLGDNSLKVIADHIRACAFLVADGVLPGNEGRGYVLRRIIRRAVRHGHKLGVSEPFFYRLVPALVEVMGEAYPELGAARTQIERVLRQEEERFRETLELGMRLLESDLASLSGDTIPGETAFRLYDTYGFPLDLTSDIARERGLKVDLEGFEAAMDAQRRRGQEARHFKAEYLAAGAAPGGSEFSGYSRLVDRGTVIGLYRAGSQVERLDVGEEGMVVLDRTPFYAESGGQVGDHGALLADGVDFEVEDTAKYGSAHGHLGRVRSGAVTLGQSVQARVDGERRQAIVLNHSATHLLHAALRQLLGKHVTQKGSLVAPERLRFDFAHFEPLSSEQLSAVERLVNERIRANDEAHIEVVGYDEAIRSGAMALFGEKYGDEVRVLKLGEFSTELCGGTHVCRTGDIGLFKIVSEGGVAAGIRRIEAVTGDAALRLAAEESARLDRLARLLKVSPDKLESRLAQMLERDRQLEKEAERLQQKLAVQAGSDLAAQAVDIGGVRVLAAEVDGSQAKSLREMVDQLKSRLGSAVVVLAAVDGGKVSIVAGVTKDCSGRVSAGELVSALAAQVGGKGGGRPDFAQAGGSDPAALPAAMRTVPEWIRQRLASAV